MRIATKAQSAVRGVHGSQIAATKHHLRALHGTRYAQQWARVVLLYRPKYVSGVPRCANSQSEPKALGLIEQRYVAGGLVDEASALALTHLSVEVSTTCMCMVCRVWQRYAAKLQ